MKLTSRALAVLTHTFGVVAFLYPFFLRAPAVDERAAHASDAPWLFSAFAALLVAIAVAELRAGALGAKEIALLGVLAGINAVLRLPGSLGGASLMFVLPIMAGAAFGARFGFLLGASSMAASALITGGVGPWLPFQMWALGWIGAGGALVGRRADVSLSVARQHPVTHRGSATGKIVVLCAYGWVAGLVFGALVNLWFWPFQQGAGDLGWRPGLGAMEGLKHYWRFYVVTSLAWDAGRALGNVVLIAVLGRPLLRMFGRARARLHTTWETAPASMRAA